MYTINQIINSIDTVERNLNETNNCDYCENVYRSFVELKNNLDITCPYKICEKIEIIINLAHRRHSELNRYESNTIYHKLDKIFDNIIHTTKSCQIKERQITIMY